jgi:REP-associated tyrosine transposase
MTYYERNLPHWHPPGKTLFVTWRLYGSLPATAIQAVRTMGSLPQGKRFAEFDQRLDSCQDGPMWLKDERIAPLVVEALKKAHGDGLCKLHAYVVMPNHVHVVLEPDLDLARITKLVKGRTARAANQILRRTGKYFWQDESFDHWVRSSPEFERIWAYIERNPVKAGFVQRPEDWKWSSAYEAALHGVRRRW